MSIKKAPCLFLLLVVFTCFGANAQTYYTPGDASQSTLVGFNAIGLTVSSINLGYDLTIGLTQATTGNAEARASGLVSPNSAPPRVVAGVYSITIGTISLLCANNTIPTDLPNPLLVKRLAISNISLGCANILIGPLFRMIPYITTSRHAKNEKIKSLDVETSFVGNPYNPRSIGLGFTATF